MKTERLTDFNLPEMLHRIVYARELLTEQFDITSWYEDRSEPGMVTCSVCRTMPCTAIYEWQQRRWLFFGVKQTYRFQALYPTCAFTNYAVTAGLKQRQLMEGYVTISDMEMRENHSRTILGEIVKIRIEEAVTNITELLEEGSLTTWQVLKRIIFSPRALWAFWRFRPALEPHVLIIW